MSKLTIDFGNFCTACTTINRHSSALSDSALSIFGGLTALASQMELPESITYFVLDESEWHTISVTTNLNIAYAELGKAIRDMMLKLVICLSLHKASQCQ